MTSRTSCPACGNPAVEVFHEQTGIPVNSCLLVDDEVTAREFPTGDLALGWCSCCGFVTNTAFDPALSTYSEQYEETQGFSPRFREFATELATDWIERHDLRGRDILEIGCGKGEFLELICRLGDNRGTGIDPSYVPGRVGADDPRLTFLAERWSHEHAHLMGDAVICRHTLEHIAPVGDFVSGVRSTIGDRTGTAVLFELPDVARVLEEPAFWDIYYEHCSYFSAGSLARLFRAHDFDVVDLRLAYDDQYLLLDAFPTARPTAPALDLEDDLPRLEAAVAAFPRRHAEQTDVLRRAVEEAGRRGEPVVVWGAGSKAVSFLSTLGIGDEVTAAVDVNPYKQGRFLAGTGHRVIAPAELVDDPPGTVFVMNAIYEDEVTREVRGMGLDARIVPL